MQSYRRLSPFSFVSVMNYFRSIHGFVIYSHVIQDFVGLHIYYICLSVCVCSLNVVKCGCSKQGIGQETLRINVGAYHLLVWYQLSWAISLTIRLLTEPIPGPSKSSGKHAIENANKTKTAQC